MSIEYAEQKVIEALELHDSNKAKANKQLMEWVYSDHQLLLGLTGMHLNGIIPYWTERVERKESVAAQTSDKTAESVENQQDDPKTFGEEMLRSFAGQGTAVFGLEAGSRPLAKKSASQRHIDAINLIANKKNSDK